MLNEGVVASLLDAVIRWCTCNLFGGSLSHSYVPVWVSRLAFDLETSFPEDQRSYQGARWRRGIVSWKPLGRPHTQWRWEPRPGWWALGEGGRGGGAMEFTTEKVRRKDSGHGTKPSGRVRNSLSHSWDTWRVGPGGGATELDAVNKGAETPAGKKRQTPPRGGWVTG